jgi:hypothetical protein
VTVRGVSFRSPSTEGERNDTLAANSSNDYLAQMAVDYCDHSQLGNELWGLHLAIVYFVPVFVAALLGGMIATSLIPRRLTPANPMNPEESTALTG